MTLLQIIQSFAGLLDDSYSLITDSTNPKAKHALIHREYEVWSIEVSFNMIWISHPLHSWRGFELNPNGLTKAICFMRKQVLL